MEKKSFILYSDFRATLDQLPDETAGKLFKHIYQLVHGEEPVIEDLILRIAFEPIRNSLLRDAAKWQEKRAALSEAGRKGGKKSAELRKDQSDPSQVKPGQATLEQAQAFQAVSVSVSVNDSVSESATVDSLPASECVPVQVAKLIPLQTAVSKQIQVAGPAAPEWVAGLINDVQAYFLDHPQKLNSIIEQAGKTKEVAEKSIAKLHSWLVEKNKYPLSLQQVESRFLRWLIDERKDYSIQSPPPTSGQSVEELRRRQHEEHLKNMEVQWQEQKAHIG